MMTESMTSESVESRRRRIFEKCQRVFPAWSEASIEDFDFDSPKGFSSITMGVRSQVKIEPPAVLYRHLAGKKNAILDAETEKSVFLQLGHEKIAAECYHYDEECRIEAFYHGHTLSAQEVVDPENLRKIAGELHRFHQLKPGNLPQQTFFELLHRKWGEQAKKVIVDQRHLFPENEARMCQKLERLFSEETISKVRRLLPQEDPVFCHNDTYQGNIMKLDSGGGIKLLDFEFSCLNHRAFDFSNLFAETVMKHGEKDYPYFRIAQPEYSDHEIAVLINAYLDHDEFSTSGERDRAFELLLENTKSLIVLSHYMYSMAALTLALQPIQKLRFLPYALERFSRFVES